MDSALAIHRLHFAFTITYHYIFPQLTMGLALLILILKTLALKTGDEHYNDCARFWIRLFGINFAMGVVTGIPMEFQFGTNWARFSRAAGGVIGQTLAMEGVYSFFLESTFLGLLVYGEKRLSKLAHWFAALAVFAGSWLSGYFIIVTDAWMQHPVGYKIGQAGDIQLDSITALFFNPWLMWQYLHNMTGAVVTGAFTMCAVGAFYLLEGKHDRFAKTSLTLGVITGFIASMTMAFPTGDGQGKMVAQYQPATLAAMEGLFHSEKGAPLAILGQPDMDKLQLDNPLLVPKLLSFLTYQRWSAEVRGLDEFPREQWPDNLPLLFYSFHIMIGLGTIFIAVTGLALLLLFRGALWTAKPILWALMLLLPFPFIANTAGWMTAEIGRQPWLIYGLMRTDKGFSANVSAGNGLFTLMGFMGMYGLLTILYLFMMQRELQQGPEGGGH